MADFPYAADFSFVDPATGLSSMFHVRAQDIATFRQRLNELQALVPIVDQLQLGRSLSATEATAAMREPSRPAPVAAAPVESATQCPEHGQATTKPSQYGGLFCTARLDADNRCNWRARAAATA